MNSIASEPHRLALLGHPISHSWSPFIHGLFAKQTGRTINYRLIDVLPFKFRATALQFFAEGGRGLNVTVPHKQAAAELVNNLTPRAQRARAVNTIRMEDNDQLLGDNTDGTGLMTDLTRNLNLSVERATVLILGAGGAARGILEPLLEAKPSAVVIANRTASKAAELAAEFADLGPVTGCGFQELFSPPFNLVINATSASLQDEVPAIPEGMIDSHTFCYDMAYGKGETTFTQWAMEQGAADAVKGWGMLVEQAAESFNLWYGVRPDTKPVLEALTSL